MFFCTIRKDRIFRMLPGEIFIPIEGFWGYNPGKRDYGIADSRKLVFFS